MTVREAAEARGIRTFDGALPQAFVDQVRDRFGYDVRGNFVMSYDKSPLGNVAPITSAGDDMERGMIEGGFFAMRYADLR